MADWVIARRGPGRDAIRQPFENLLAGYDSEHAQWVTAFPVDSIAPKLNTATRDHFLRLSRQARLPPPRYHLDAILAAVPRSSKLWLVDNQARWSGDTPLADIATFWSDDSTQRELTVIDPPDHLGPALAHAVARLAIHSPRASFLVDVARWQPFLTTLSSASPSAADLRLPSLRALGGDPSILNSIVCAPNDLAADINRRLDSWLLEAVDRHLKRYISHAEDPGHLVSFVAAADIREQMGPTWQGWIHRFRTEPGLLPRFFGLAVCAKDDEQAGLEGTVLAGRLLLKPLIRACAVALTVATTWQVIAPRDSRPGNLRRDINGTVRSGHTCAATFIDNEDMAIMALRHAWTTEFVLLPMQSAPTAMIMEANHSLSNTSDVIPLLGQSGV
ncbi:ABC-three component system protein, partial [Rhizobium rosettiformans]